MALKPLNSVGGFSVGEIPDTIIDGDGNITGYYATFEGNLAISNATASWGILTDNLYYSNGVPWDLQEAAGSNTEIQFNNNGNFGASNNFTFNTATNVLTVNGNVQFNNANLGNLVTANYANISTTINSSNINVTNNLTSYYANFTTNVDITNNITFNNAIVGGGNVYIYSNGGATYQNVVNVNNTVIMQNANIGGGNVQIYNNGGAYYSNVINFNSNTYVYPNGAANFSNVVTVNNNTFFYSNGGAVFNNTVNFSNLVYNYSNGVTNWNSNTFIYSNGTATFNNQVSVNNATYIYSNGTVNFSTNAYIYNNGGATFNNTVNYSNLAYIYNNGGATFANVVNFNNATYIYENGYVSFSNTTNWNNNVYIYSNGTANFSNNVVFQNNINITNNLNISNTINVNNNSVIIYSNGSANFDGNVYADYFIGNVEANITITAANTTVLFSDAGLVDGSNAFTFNKTSNTVTMSGDLNVGTDLDVNGNINTNANLTATFANFVGNVHIAPSGANNFGVLTDHLYYANGTAWDFQEAAGSNTQIQYNMGNDFAASANLTYDDSTRLFTVLGNAQFNNANLGNLAYANYINVANDLNVIGNVNAGNLVGTLANGTSNVRIFQNANVELSSAGNANVVTITGAELLAAGNIRSTTGNMVANGNITANGFLVSANAAVTGQANVGSLLTANITAPTGNITISAAGSDQNIVLAPTGNGVVDVGLHKVIQVGDPTNPHDAATKEYVDSQAQGLSIHQAVLVTSTTNLNATYANGGSTLTTTTISGGKTITFSANHGLSVGDEIFWVNTFNGITAYDAYFVYSTPALNQITIKNGFYGAEVTTLTNGAGLTQTAKANSGVGATLTNAGANAAISIDGIALASTNRVLVQGQTNAAQNGIYTVTTVGNGSTAWVLTRATNENTYDPQSTTGLGAGDYFFVQEGSSYAGSSYVLTQPTGEILFGYSNLTFEQFSAAGSYTAGSGIAITGTTISANVDNDTTAIVSGNIVVKSGANLTTPNLGDATFSSLSWNNLSNGNVTANNLSIGNIANITLDLTVGGNIQANGTISSNANVSGLNLTTTGNVEAGGNVLAGNVTANSTVFAANANVTGTTITDALTVNTALTGNTANFSGNVTLNNLTVNLELAGNTANFTGNVVANNFSTSGSGGNITGANVVIANTFQGNLVATTGNISGNLIVNNLTVNVETAGNTANFSGNVVVNNFVSNGLANVGNLHVVSNVTSDLLPNANLTLDLGDITQRWNNVYAGNLDVSGNLNSTGNLTANNFSANIFTANVKVDVGTTQIIYGNVTTTSITANQTIASAPISGVTGVEWMVKGYDSSGAKYTMALVTAVTDGSLTEFSTFGTVQLGGTTGTLAVNVVGSNIELQVTPASSNSTVWVTQYRTV